MYQPAKFLQYEYLTTETECIWKVKTTGIPIIIGTTGTTSESFTKKNLKT
jgi:hypothetical protein